MTNRRAILSLVLLISACFAVYLNGNGSVPLWDRDEPRFAQTSRQMLQSRDWVVPHYLELIRTAKPALIYWCQASAMALLGDNAFAARLPSALGMALTLILVASLLWRTAGPTLAVWTTLILGTAGLSIMAAKMCITDAVLLLFVTTTQACLYALWRGRTNYGVVLAMAVAIGLGLLTKGPVVLGVATTTLLVLGLFRWWDGRSAHAAEPIAERPITLDATVARFWARAFVAIFVVAAITLPWVLMVNHRAAEFLKTAVSHDVWDRMLTPLEQHSGPPGYYFAFVWASFFPWSIFIPLAMVLAWRGRSRPDLRFCLAAILGPWIMLECVRTKLPHYFLPVLPPLAYLTADALRRNFSGELNDLRAAGFRGGIAIWSMIVLLIGLSPWIMLKTDFRPLPWIGMVALSIVAMFYAAAVFALFQRKRLQAGVLAMGLGMLAVIVALFGVYLPNAAYLQISPRVADVLIDHGATGAGQVMMLDYKEPSLAFYQGGTIRESGQLWMKPQDVPLLPKWIVLTRNLWASSPVEVTSQYELIGDVYGLAYADRGRWYHVVVARKKADARNP